MTVWWLAGVAGWVAIVAVYMALLFARGEDDRAVEEVVA